MNRLTLGYRITGCFGDILQSWIDNASSPLNELYQISTCTFVVRTTIIEPTQRRVLDLECNGVGVATAIC